MALNRVVRCATPILLACLAMLLSPSGLSAAENWISNGDFESDQPLPWRGAVVDHDTVHAGRGSLRLDVPAGKTEANARLHQAVKLNQTEAQPIMAAFWVRFDAQRQTGSVRGGMTFRVEMVDGSSLAWYSPFEVQSSEVGSWVYHEARWMPRASVAQIQPSLYLRGCEGSVWVDDLYLGPAATRPSSSRQTIPMAVTGESGRFTDWPRFESLAFRPMAHVFHLGQNKANIELTWDVNVLKPAPAYLTSAWGSQYWTLYSPGRKELAQIFTNERLDLSQPGKHAIQLPMSGFSSGASDLAPGGYVFVTDTSKSFLIYGTEQPAKSSRKGPKDWDTVKVELLSRHLGPSGIAAPFALADLTSYSVTLCAQSDGDTVEVQPALVDAQKNAVPLYDLKLSAEADGKSLVLEPEFDADGAPTGNYRGKFSSGKIDTITVKGKVRLATVTGVKEESLDRVVDVARPAKKVGSPSPKLDLMAWSYASYELSPAANHGPQSMARLMADARSAGVTKLAIHARSSRETFYPSRIASSAAVGQWDALATAVAEGKRQGVGIYAAYVLGVAQDADLKEHPDWAALDSNGKQNGWYCYTNPEVHAFHAAMLAEIVSRYEVAGVSLDYCRPGGGCFCARCQHAFEAKYSKRLKGIDVYDPDWRTWQRACVTEYLRELREAVRMARPDAQLGGYVWGRFSPDKDRAGQDWPRWLKEGILNFVAVGQYSPSTVVFRAECHTLRTIAESQLHGDLRRICPLLGVGYIEGANPSHAAAAAVIDRHLQAARDEGLPRAGYFALFSIRNHQQTSASHSIHKAATGGRAE